jgi:arylsulfatase A-like enzyme
MPAELKPVLARQMEIYAGFMEQTDHQIGRLFDTLKDLGALDDTLIYYIMSASVWPWRGSERDRMKAREGRDE